MNMNKDLGFNEIFVLGYMQAFKEGQVLTDYDRDNMARFLKTSEIDEALDKLVKHGLIGITYHK
jgi:hypothetical protein